MLGNVLTLGSPFVSPPILAQGDYVVSPAAVLVLCVVAGIGTLLLLPSARETSFRAIGGVILIAAGLIFAALVAHSAAATEGQAVYFWIFSAIALIGAVRVVTHPRPVYSALYFVLTVFATAGLFILLWAEFMAAALILIYAGAILITYVFVIMLATQAQTGGNKARYAGLADYDALSREPLIACCVGFALMGVLMYLIFDKASVLPIHQPPTVQTPIESPLNGATQQLGEYLFKNQLVNLELAGLILTVSMVGAIVIARRRVVDNIEVYEPAPETVTGPATPVNDDPHSIPVVGTDNPRQKAYPET